VTLSFNVQPLVDEPGKYAYRLLFFSGTILCGA